MKKIFKFSTLVWLAAVFLASCAAFVSVVGLSKLFAGAGITIMIMMAGLETAKLITATALHRYWNRFSGLMKLYMTTAVIVLISITSMGIYGFLSNAYKQTSDKLNVEMYELNTLDAKRLNYEKAIENLGVSMQQKTDRSNSLHDIRKNQEVRLDSLFSKNQVTNANRLRTDISKIESEISKINSEVDDLNKRILTYGDSISVLDIKIIEVKSTSEMGAELGPLIYISDLTGMSMDRVVNYLTLIIMLVFDPLAVILLLGANRIVEIETGTEPTDTGGGGNPMKRLWGTIKDLKPFKKKVVKEPVIPIIEHVEAPYIDILTEPYAQPIKKNNYSDDDIAKIKQNLSKKSTDGRGFSVNIPKK